MTDIEIVKKNLSVVYDWPIKGIKFLDITPLFLHPEAHDALIRLVIQKLETEFKEMTTLVVVAARGFLFGTTVAYLMKKKLVLIRREGKLPPPIAKYEYKTEYGTSSRTIHTDDLTIEDKVVVVDDIIALGGTTIAACELVKEAGGTLLGALNIMDLTYLPKKPEVANYHTTSIINIDS